jgi:hypothetical protein
MSIIYSGWRKMRGFCHTSCGSRSRRDCAARITGQAARVFTEFRYATLKTWERERRVIAKAEHLPGKAKPRFVVTSLPEWEVTWDEQVRHNDARTVYEKLYCARGERENRLKEQQLDLFADRTSTHWLKANQVRVWLSAAGYVVVNAVRRTALAGTELARAYCGTIRLALFKIGGVVRVSVRRITVALSSAYPRAVLFGRVLQRLRAAPA